MCVSPSGCSPALFVYPGGRKHLSLLQMILLTHLRAGFGKESLTAVVIVTVNVQIHQEADEATVGQKSKPSVVLFTNKLFSDIYVRIGRQGVDEKSGSRRT